ncbi:MAG: aspartate aminotransferase family protein [Turicibacter sp.]|nr:aspartate aminotransferase family protein [Turicibacter sp.]
MPIGPAKIIEKKKEYLVPCSYHFYKDPPQLVKGKMQHLWDHEGKSYVDFFAGVSVMNCGHCNPEILGPIMDQMGQLQHTTTIYLTEPSVGLAQRLAAIAPKGLKRSFFCSTGSEANEGAMLLAELYTGKNGFLALDLGLHGRTRLAMSATGIGMWRATGSPSGNVHFVPNPYCYRCPYEKEPDCCGFACVNGIKEAISRRGAGHFAAMLCEPIQGNGGIIVPPMGYFKALKAVLDEFGILLIIDEVQTGFARTGKMFAIEHFDVVPDVMTVAKALGNGQPISAFITSDQMAKSFTTPSASTLGGNPVSAAAGIAVLDYLEKNQLAEKARILGGQLMEGLKRLQKTYPIIGDVRGLGLMIGAELVYPDKSPNPEAADEILETMKDFGFLIGKNGEHRHVLAFQPPLVITAGDISSMLECLERALEGMVNDGL